ncbi:MAG: Alpha-L-rhamnosidase, partial [Bacteroidetes bacterium]
RDVMGTAYFAYSTNLAAKMAEIIGRMDVAEKYERLFGEIRRAFIEAYVFPDGRIKGETQTCYLLAIRFGLLDEKCKKLAAEHLVKDIERKGWHLSTGFVGVGYLLPVLSDMGYDEVAYRLLMNESYPSWGYSIKNGATTIWERWNSYTAEDGFGDVGMNSFNHYSLGSVGEWMYHYAAGIEADEMNPGYKHIRIRPRPNEAFRFVRAKYRSVLGDILSEWELDGDVFRLNVEIPANTTATVYLPCCDRESVRINGVGPGDSEYTDIIGYENGCAVLRITSGVYHFET